MTVQLLERPMYAEPEAARLLQVAPSTLHYWLEGGERRGKQYSLSAVSCVSPDDCTAVGQQDKGLAGQTLAELWDGKRWALSPTPRHNGLSGLNSVWCTSAVACTAVGFTTPTRTSGTFTLVESWDGHGWSVVPSPNRGSFSSSLRSVSCTLAGTCAAVGDYEGPASVHYDDETLMEVRSSR